MKKINFVENKGVINILFVLNTLFVIYFLILSIYNNLSQDDYLFLKSIKTDGVFAFVRKAYMYQSGRFTAYLFNSIVFFLISKTVVLYYVPIAIWVICFMILSYVLNRFVIQKLFVILNLSALILNVFIITNFEFTAFYWICASMNYLIPFLFLLIFALVNMDKLTNIEYILLIITSLIASGSSEIYVTIGLGILIVNYAIINKLTKLKFINFSTTKNRRFLIVFLILMVGLIITVIAPGNYNRAAEAIFHHPKSVFEFIIISIKSFILFFYLLFFKLPYYVILILISFSIGVQNKKINLAISYRKFLLYSWTSFFIFIYLSVLPMSFLMSGFGFQRVYTFAVFISILFFVVQGFLLGVRQAKMNFLVRSQNQLIVFYLLIFCVVMITNIYIDTPIAKKYHNDITNRNKQLLDLKHQNTKGVVELEPLRKPYTYNLKYLILKEKQPMLYYDNEISSDSTGYVNDCLRAYYDLDFQIVLKE